MCGFGWRWWGGGRDSYFMQTVYICMSHLFWHETKIIKSTCHIIYLACIQHNYAIIQNTCHFTLVIEHCPPLTNIMWILELSFSFYTPVFDILYFHVKYMILLAERHLIKINISRWIIKPCPYTWWNLATGYNDYSEIKFSINGSNFKVKITGSKIILPTERSYHK